MQSIIKDDIDTTAVSILLQNLQPQCNSSHEFRKAKATQTKNTSYENREKIPGSDWSEICFTNHAPPCLTKSKAIQTEKIERKWELPGERAEARSSRQHVISGESNSPPSSKQWDKFHSEKDSNRLPTGSSFYDDQFDQVYERLDSIGKRVSEIISSSPLENLFTE